jgi:hypothetical protein
MKRVFIILSIISFLFNGCVSLRHPFAKRSSIEIKEGILSLKTINSNLAKQMPLTEKIGSNEVKIVSATVFASDKPNKLLVELEFIFTSFEIPEGLPCVARTTASIDYNPKTKEFKFARIAPIEIKFLKEELLEYVTPQQRKFIPETLMVKLYTLILHKSKKELTQIKSFTIKSGKIKIEFK